MSIPRYTADDLKRLPLRAIVAFAARCALRVEPFALPPDTHPEHEKCRKAVRDAIQMAEDFARGVPCPSCKSVVSALETTRSAAQGSLVREHAMAAVVEVAHAAATAMEAVDLQSEPEERHLLGPTTRPFAHVAQVTAELAALDSFTATVDASDAVGYANDVVTGIDGDYQKLVKLDLGRYPDAGKPIDPSSSGPLGPLR